MSETKSDADGQFVYAGAFCHSERVSHAIAFVRKDFIAGYRRERRLPCFLQTGRGLLVAAVYRCTDAFKICGYLLPGVDPDRFAADLQEVIYQSCLQGTPYVVQRTLNHTLLRGLFEVDGIRYIDEHLKLDKFNVCV